MNVLVTGANGFLGRHLIAALIEKGISVVATGKGASRLPYTANSVFQYAEMDFTNTASVKSVFSAYQPTLIVHAGAISKPDDCELDKEMAWRINVTGTENLLAAAHNCHFIFISTDFVFDGMKGMYEENDEPAPVNYYGLTKLKAENLVKQHEYSWAIVRTVLVYGKPLSGRSNILTIVRDKLLAGELYKVVSDQIRTPTYVEDLASGIVAIIEKDKTGIWHLSGEEILTPFEMASHTADFLGLNKGLLENVNASTFTQPAQRPLRTGFNIAKAKKELRYKPVSFAEGLRKTFF